MLTVEFSGAGPLCVLTLSGALVSTSIAALEVQIDQIGETEFANVVLDVTNLRMIDLAGIRQLMKLSGHIERLGARLTISGACGQVAAVLAGTHLPVISNRRAEPRYACTTVRRIDSIKEKANSLGPLRAKTIVL
jgi:anti-anti-sigma regulatory factor